MCLPGLEEKDVDDLIAYRTTNSAGEEPQLHRLGDGGPGRRPRRSASASYITVHSNQYSADIIAVSGNGRAYKRYKAVVDTQKTPPRVVYWRELTHFGWPLDAGDCGDPAERQASDRHGFEHKQH